MDAKKLLNACETRNFIAARAMLRENPKLIYEARDYFGTSPALYACYWGDIETLKAIAPYQNAFQCPDSNGYTPAHAAAVNGHLDCLRFLVESSQNGAAILEAKTKSGNTPAHEAARTGRIDTLKFIVSRGADVLNMKNLRNKTPLDVGTEGVRYHFGFRQTCFI